MAIALVQNVPATGVGTANPSATIAAATAGNLIVAVLSVSLSSAGITDPAGYTRRKAQNNGASTSCTCHIGKIAAGGETAVTFTVAASNWDLEVMEWSGVDVASEFDAAVGAPDAGSNISSLATGSLTPALSGELLIVGMSPNGTNGGSEAIDSGFTVLDAATFSRGMCGYKIKTDALAENPTLSWATARRIGVAMTAWKPTVGGGSVVLPDRSYPRGVDRGILRGVA